MPVVVVAVVVVVVVVVAFVSAVPIRKIVSLISNVNI